VEQLRLRRSPRPGSLPTPPFEMHFGLTDKSGKRKRNWRRSPTSRASSPISTRRAGAHRGRGSDRGARALRAGSLLHYYRLPQGHPRQSQAGIHRRPGADLPVTLLRELDGLDKGPKLLILPSAKLLMAQVPRAFSSWRREGDGLPLILRRQRASQVGPWMPWLGELFRDPPPTALRARRSDRGRRGGVQFHRASATDTRRRASLPGRRQRDLARLPTVEPAGATVVALDGTVAPPSCTERSATGPWSCAPTRPSTCGPVARVNPESTWRLYSALATSAGVDRPLTVDDPRVITGRSVSAPESWRCGQRLAGSCRGEPQDGRGRHLFTTGRAAQ